MPMARILSAPVRPSPIPSSPAKEFPTWAVSITAPMTFAPDHLIGIDHFTSGAAQIVELQFKNSV